MNASQLSKWSEGVAQVVEHIRVMQKKKKERKKKVKKKKKPSYTSKCLPLYHF
jgi:hypothetical protein